MDMMKTGQLISQVRKERGMTQQQLAESLNITAAAVSKWERGHSFPDISIFEPLADALDISVIALIRGEQEIESYISVSEAEISVREAIGLVVEDLERSRAPEAVRRFFAPSNYPKALSIVLLIVGLVLAITGNVLAMVFRQSEGTGLIIGGAIIFLIALFLWAWSKVIILRNNRLLQSGVKINATAIRIRQKHSMDMPFQKNAHPYCLDFQYSIGEHTYNGHSPLMWNHPNLTSKSIEIYVNPKRPKQYFMDIAQLVQK